MRHVGAVFVVYEDDIIKCIHWGIEEGHSLEGRPSCVFQLLCLECFYSEQCIEHQYSTTYTTALLLCPIMFFSPDTYFPRLLKKD